MDRTLRIGNDTLDGGDGNDLILGDDRYHVAPSINVVAGGSSCSRRPTAILITAMAGIPTGTTGMTGTTTTGTITITMTITTRTTGTSRTMSCWAATRSTAAPATTSSSATAKFPTPSASSFDLRFEDDDNDGQDDGLFVLNRVAPGSKRDD